MVNKAKIAALIGMLSAEGVKDTMVFRKSPEPTFGVPRGNTRRRWPAEPTYCIRCGEPKPENKAFCSAACCRLWKSGDKKQLDI